ncbi:MAG: hypothetical protein P4L46_22540 [Fimbriimonas sp.]|nr:hypothetical protein [Fimbriimonas sp.]
MLVPAFRLQLPAIQMGFAGLFHRKWWTGFKAGGTEILVRRDKHPATLQALAGERSVYKVASPIGSRAGTIIRRLQVL